MTLRPRYLSKYLSLVTSVLSLFSAGTVSAATGETELVLDSFFDADFYLSIGYGNYDMPSLSADGNLIAFSGQSDYLSPPGGHSIATHIYVLDRTTNQLERISARTDDGTPGDWISWGSSISADGNSIAFLSKATNLVDGDTNGVADVFLSVREGENRSISRLTADPPPGTAESWPYQGLQISANGRHVAFASNLDGLVPADTNGTWDVYVYDVDAGQLELVSVNSSGIAAGTSDWGPSISADGQIVGFVSRAADLVPGVGNGQDQVYVRNRDSDTTVLVSADPGGQPASGGAWVCSVNSAGTLVAFAAEGQNLSSIDDHGKAQVYVRDLANGTTDLVSLVDGSTDQAGSNDSDLFPGALASGRSLSDDGRFVAFASRSPNDLTAASAADRAVFVRDRTRESTRLVSRSTDGSTSVGATSVAISGDGRYLSFTSGMYLYEEYRDCCTSFIYVHDLGPTEPVEMIEEIVDLIVDLNLDNGISNSLDAKLESALGALSDVNENNDAAACNSLSALINAITAQSGNQIDPEEAADLIDAAGATMSQIGCE